MNIQELILHEDADHIIINKPAGIASQDSQNQHDSVWSFLEKERGAKYHLSNRLDQPVSGCLLFQSHKPDSKPDQMRVHKVYIAIVEKKDIPEKATLTHYLKRNPKSSKSICKDKKEEGFKKAVLHYTVIAALDRYLILKVILPTGRFHQIRSQLSHMGIPIKGDVKYGARRKNQDRSIHLHAWQLILNPTTEEELVIEAPFPTDDTLWNETQTILNG